MGPFAGIDIGVFILGTALGVWKHDTFVKWWQGAEAFAANLKAKAATIEAQVSAAKAAATAVKQ